MQQPAQHTPAFMASTVAAQQQQAGAMMQGMAMPVPMMMGPMGPMGYASMLPFPVPMMMVGGHMMMMMGPPPLPPHQAALLDAACRGRPAAVFYKTRICHKWRKKAGCPFGDKCTFAHGRHELRSVPPEVAALLELSLEQRQLWSAAGVGEQGQQQGQEQHEQQEEEEEEEEEREKDEQPSSSPAAPRATASTGSGSEGGISGDGPLLLPPPPPLFFKTRLCGSFTQAGYCARASSCTFAHGWRELRHPGAPHAPPAGGAPHTQWPMPAMHPVRAPTAVPATAAPAAAAGPSAAAAAAAAAATAAAGLSCSSPTNPENEGPAAAAAKPPQQAQQAAQE